MAYQSFRFVGPRREASLQNLLEAHPDAPKDDPVEAFAQTLRHATRSQVPTVDISSLRKRLGFTQEEFAYFYGLRLLSVRNWEQGRRRPDRAAKTLLVLIYKEPATISRITETSLKTACEWFYWDLRHLRERLNLDQKEFARQYGLSALSVRNWEQGRRRPHGSAKILLALIENEPETIRRILLG
jgi:putative transcriptional regulator